jgi:exopolysaccharide biosynthesis polyprenyl glycosylphosphotransferase
VGPTDERVTVGEDGATTIASPFGYRRRLEDLAAELELRAAPIPETAAEAVALEAETRRRAAVFRRSLAIADLLAAFFTLTVVAVVYQQVVQPAMFVACLVVLLAAKVGRLYDRDEVRLRKSTLEEVPALFQLSGIAALVVWLGEDLLVVSTLGRWETLTLWLLLFFSLVCGRVAARYVAARRLPTERCLLVGDPSSIDEIAAKLAGRGAEIVGFLPIVERRTARPSRPSSAPVDALEELVRRTRAHRVLLVPGPHAEADVTLSCVSRAQAMGTYVSILPRMCEVVGSSVEFDHVDGMTLLGVHGFGLSRSSIALKRAVDVVGATVLLAAAAPIMLAATVAVKLSSAGPVFFRQTRVGQSGEPFAMLKFRSMYDGADQARAELAALSNAGDGMFKVAGDPRVTPVGRLLRRYSLDELPQLLNVLRGEMSLVGPRPLIVDEDANIIGHHRLRLRLTPGITGPWQVLGTAQRRVPMRDMVTLDYLYAGNWSLWTDVKIILRTAVHVVRGHGL